MAIINSAGWSFEVNFVPSTLKTEVIVAIVEAAKDAGWTLENFSDGTTVTSGALLNPTAAQLNNNNAWVHLSDPDGTFTSRHMSIQRGLNDFQWRVFLSKKGDPMTGGTGATAPVASGAMAQLVGTGGNFFNSWLGAVGTRRYHIAFNSAATGETGNVYSFYVNGRTTGTGAWGQGSMSCFAVSTFADGTFGDADSEPWVGHNGTDFNAGAVSGWYKAGLTGESFVIAGIRVLEQTELQRVVNPHSGTFSGPPIYAYDDTAAFDQVKGLIEKETAYWKALSSHVTGDTYNLTVEGFARVIFDRMAVIWPHNVPPVL